MSWGELAAAGAQQTVGLIAGALSTKAAWRRQQTVLKNQIQWRQADMKAAGINPILAAGSAGGGAPSVAAQPIHKMDILSNAKSMTQMSMQNKILRSQVKIAENNVHESWAAAGRAGSEWTMSEYNALRNRLNLEKDELGMAHHRSQGAMDKSEWGGRLRQLNRAIRSITGRDATTSAR